MRLLTLLAASLILQAAESLPLPLERASEIPVLDSSLDVLAFAMDSNGNLYVGGQTRSPIADARLYGTGGEADMYVMKLDPLGQHVLFAIRMGGVRDDRVVALKVDALGNVFGMGFTQSENYPYSSFTGSGASYGPVIFKLDSTGRVVYNVVFGWTQSLSGFEIDAAGSVYFSGSAVAGQVPVHAGAYNRTPSSPLTAGFIAKLNSAGSVDAATYLGTSAMPAVLYRQLSNGDLLFSSDGTVGELDPTLSVLVNSQVASLGAFAGTDRELNLYFVATSESDRLVLSKYSPDGRQLLMQHEYPYPRSTAIVDPTGAVFLSGIGGASFPVRNAVQPCRANGDVPYSIDTPTLVKITPAGEVAYATYFGAEVNARVMSPLDGKLYAVGRVDGSPSLTYSLLKLDPIYSPPDHISAGCLVHAATFKYGAISPGAIMTLFGDRIGPATGMALTATNDRFPLAVGGWAISVDGKPAPLLYSQSGQVNFVVPWSIRTDGQAVHVCATASNDTQCLYAPTTTATPGFFLHGSTIAAINQDGSINSETSPAPRGSYVALYMTGTGALQRAVDDGQVAGSDLVGLKATVSASMVDNFPPCVLHYCGAEGTAEISYSGSAPTLVFGGTQINIKIPAIITPGRRGLILTLRDGATSVSTQGYLWIAQ